MLPEDAIALLVKKIPHATKSRIKGVGQYTLYLRSSAHPNSRQMLSSQATSSLKRNPERPHKPSQMCLGVGIRRLSPPNCRLDKNYYS